jgi:hypothetical protein
MRQACSTMSARVKRLVTDHHVMDQRLVFDVRLLGEGWIESESTQVLASLRQWSSGDHPVIIVARLRCRGLKRQRRRSWLWADRFLGSGSTLIAADRTGRVCRGVEVDPVYVDVIVRRYEAAIGNQAVLDEIGRPFDALAARRAGRRRRSRGRIQRRPFGSIKPCGTACGADQSARRCLHVEGPAIRNPLSSTRKSD